ncbi:MAG: 2-oxoacid:acceptor oxidoreductase family protein [Candidatus Aminicenantia bacterium]
MKDMLEIRWHGRGGQGVVTAAVTLADILAPEGKYVQAFPEFGAEKRGAPILAFNRISDRPIRLHSQVKFPDIVIVTDPTLLGQVDIKSGTNDDAIIIINTTFDLNLIKEKLKLHPRKVYTLDAYTIANEEFGRPIPNVPMLAALMKVTTLLPVERFKQRIEKSLSKKLRTEVVKGNLRTIDRAYKEVKGE